MLLVDRPVDRGIKWSPPDRPTESRLLSVRARSTVDMGRSTGDRGHGSVDRPVDRQTRSGFPFRIRIPFLFGIESSRGFLKPRNSVAINKG